jgi:hypothetical protein
VELIQLEELFTEADEDEAVGVEEDETRRAKGDEAAGAEEDETGGPEEVHLAANDELPAAERSRLEVQDFKLTDKRLGTEERDPGLAATNVQGSQMKTQGQMTSVQGRKKMT